MTIISKFNTILLLVSATIFIHGCIVRGEILHRYNEIYIENKCLYPMSFYVEYDESSPYKYFDVWTNEQMNSKDGHALSAVTDQNSLIIFGGGKPTQLTYSEYSGRGAKVYLPEDIIIKAIHADGRMEMINKDELLKHQAKGEATIVYCFCEDSGENERFKQYE